MQIDKITSEKIPDEFNVIIEIPMNDNPVKYELDKESGAIFVDRFMQVSMFYPCNYGFIPNTLSGDGDPVDVLVLSNYPIIPGAIVKCRPIGVLMMEEGRFEKVEKTIDVWYNGVMVMGTNILLKWEMAENMVRPKSASQHALPNYVAVAPVPSK